MRRDAKRMALEAMVRPSDRFAARDDLSYERKVIARLNSDYSRAVVSIFHNFVFFEHNPGSFYAAL
jgi:hypothetical protein